MAIVCAGCSLGIGALVRVASVHPEVRYEIYQCFDMGTNPTQMASNIKLCRLVKCTSIDKCLLYLQGHAGTRELPCLKCDQL